jgi:hypothetical protein
MSALRKLVDDHKERRERIAKAAVFDAGIDLKRLRKGVVLFFPFGVNPNPPPPVVDIKVEKPNGEVTIVKGFQPHVRKVQVAKAPGFQVARIGAAVGKFYGRTWDQIKSASRKAELVAPRMVGYSIAFKISLRSLPFIGRTFGDRDHTTILYGVRKIDARAIRDFQFGSEVAALECAIRRQLEPPKC